jgi:hypothetical protein
VRGAGIPMQTDLDHVSSASLLIDTLAALGDYLRGHRLASGCGFERKDGGVVCHLRNCRFAHVARDLARQGAVCARCPVLQLAQEALRERCYEATVSEHKIVASEEVVCAFQLYLEHGPTHVKEPTVTASKGWLEGDVSV